MIKRIKKAWQGRVHSLRSGMLAVITIAVLLGMGVYVLVHTLFVNWIDNEYNSQEEKNERYDSYIANLQTYIDKKAILSTDTAQITSWMNANRNVYLFLYKDGHLFFDGSLDDEPEEDKEDTDKDTDSEGGGDVDNQDKPGSSGSSTPGEGDVTDGDGDGEKEPDDTRPGTGGITIDYPTREEIIASAEKNGLLPLEFSDGTLLVSLVDFTDYIYYDVANIVSLIAGFVVLAVILMIYFHLITTKIARLAQDVSAVYEVDMNHEIRTEDGNDELANLTKNVEQMRISMLRSLKKEKEALNANAELITSMSHDIRTPLTVLLGYLDVMKTVNSDKNIDGYIQASESTALRLKELSDDLFRYFLVFGGSEIKADIASYDAKTLIDQLFSEHILLLTEKGYEVNRQTGSGVKDGLQVLTDAPKLMRVVDNLFSNIYKYADKSKRITVAVGVARGKLNIAIKNHVDNNASNAESNGVGLKTCKKICESLGAGFDYRTTGIKNAKIFTAVIELGIAKREEEH